MNDLGEADDLWFLQILRHSARDDDLCTTIQMGLCGFLDNSAERCMGKVLVIFPGAPHRMQNVPASICLLTDQLGILPQLGPVFQLLRQFCAGQLDGRKRRAQLMGRGCNHTGQIGQLLLPPQCHLSGQ